jgi:hypothetical protein
MRYLENGRPEFNRNHAENTTFYTSGCQPRILHCTNKQKSKKRRMKKKEESIER